MKLFLKSIFILSVTVALGVSQPVRAFTLPPAPVPVQTSSPVLLAQEVVQTGKGVVETHTTLTEAVSSVNELLVTIGTFGPGFLLNTLGSLVSPQTSDTVKETVSSTDEDGKTVTPDLKDQKAVKSSAQKALTAEGKRDTEMNEIAQMRDKISKSKRAFATLGVATSWNLMVDAATIADTQPNDAYEQVRKMDNAAAGAEEQTLRKNVTTNNNIQMRLTSNMNRLVALTATRAGMAGFNGLEKSGSTTLSVFDGLNAGQIDSARSLMGTF